MGEYVDMFNEIVHVKVIKAYLYEGKSHRRIQEDILNIPAPPRGGGFVAMEILHYYGIDGSKKAILQYRTIDEELKTARCMYKNALELIRKYPSVL